MKNIKYSATHEWVSIEANEEEATVGISDYAQRHLGDIVYVDLPQVGSEVKANQECGVVESVKSASDLFSPLSGEVISINQQAIDSPELLNDDPLNAGWLFKIKIKDHNELNALMDAEAYDKFLKDE